MSNQGFFKPRNPNKYKGDPTEIVYRSGWELKFMRYLDAHPDILEWKSEEHIIPYRSPLDGKVHRYFPDFWLKKRTRDGKVEINLVEIKPFYQTIPPVRGKKKEKQFISEVRDWGVNSAKWKAAIEFCAQRNWKFIILTEKRSKIY